MGSRRALDGPPDSPQVSSEERRQHAPGGPARGVRAEVAHDRESLPASPACREACGADNRARGARRRRRVGSGRADTRRGPRGAARVSRSPSRLPQSTCRLDILPRATWSGRRPAQEEGPRVGQGSLRAPVGARKDDPLVSGRATARIRSPRGCNKKCLLSERTGRPGRDRNCQRAAMVASAGVTSFMANWSPMHLRAPPPKAMNASRGGGGRWVLSHRSGSKRSGLGYRSGRWWMR